MLQLVSLNQAKKGEACESYEVFNCPGYERYLVRNKNESSLLFYDSDNASGKATFPVWLAEHFVRPTKTLMASCRNRSQASSLDIVEEASRGFRKLLSDERRGLQNINVVSHTLCQTVSQEMSITICRTRIGAKIRRTH